jgi:uncharacterized protein (DUF2141 family)
MIPENLTDLFNDVEKNKGSISYHIIDYTDGMSMDNNESLAYFVECVDIHEDSIEEDYGTQIILSHPSYEKRVVIDSGGIGDFYSHGIDCDWEEE